MEQGVVSNFSIAEIYHALSLAYPQRVSVLTAWLAVDGKDWLPTEIWVAILSLCWRQTRTIMCVCRAWHDYVRLPAYWRRAYTEKICIFPAEFPAFAKTHFLTNFHTLDTDLFASFKDQVGWLFWVSSNIRFYKTTDGAGDEFRLLIFFNGYSVTYRIFSQGIMVEKSGLRTSALLQKVLYSTQPKYCALTRQSDFKSFHFEYIEWIDKDSNLKWQGTGRSKGVDDTYAYPEGDGTWSRLSTGEILLQGKGVAYRGYMDDDGVSYHRGKRNKI
jgi:hypothetical protein